MFGMNLIFLGERQPALEVVRALCSVIPEMLNPDPLDLDGDQATRLLCRYIVHELPPIRSSADLDRRYAFLRGVNERHQLLAFFSIQDNARSLPTWNPYIRHAVFQDKSLQWFREHSEQLWAEAKFVWENPKECAALSDDNPAPSDDTTQSRADRRKRR